MFINIAKKLTPKQDEFGTCGQKVLMITSVEEQGNVC